MTLYDLANATAIQGNVEVAVIEDGLVQRHYFYPDKASDGRIWLVIEVTEEVDL